MSGLTKEQLASRHLYLGASEIAAVVGLNPWRSAHDIWLQKLGLADDTSSVQSRVGTLVEPVIQQLYCEDMKCEVGHFGSMVHPKHSWLSATPDFEVFGAPRVGEIKMVGWRMAHHWTSEEDGVPDYYRTQGEIQMEVFDAEHCDFAALLGGTDFRIYRIARDREMAGMLIDIGAKFWRDHVIARVPPPIDGTEGAKRLLRKIYPVNLGPMKSADADAERLVTELLGLDGRDARRLELENKLKDAIRDAEGLVGDGWSVTFRANKKGVRSLRWKHKKEQAAA